MADAYTPPVQSEIEARARALGCTDFQIKSLTVTQRADLARLIEGEVDLAIRGHSEVWNRWCTQIQCQMMQIHILADVKAMQDKGDGALLGTVLQAPDNPSPI